MSLTTSEMTPADIAAVTGNSGRNDNGNGWGGDGWWVIILFFIFAWGWGGNGFGGFGGGNSATQGAITRSDLCMSESFQDVKREIQNANDAVNLGFSNLNSTICNQQYDTARMINGLESTVQGGFNATNIAMLQGQNAIQTQLAGCCCDLREAVTGVNYNLATQACDTRNTIQNGLRDSIENANANTRAILQKLDDQAMEAKNAQIAALNQQLFAAQLQASQTAQNQYLVNQLRPCPVPAYLTCSPFAAAYGFNGTSGCGCGCGCNG